MAKKKLEDTPLPPVEEGEAPTVEESEVLSGSSTQDPLTPPDPEKVINVDLYANGVYVQRAAPRSWYYDRRITLPRREARPDGKGGYVDVEVEVNLEHVDTDVHGVWGYRVM